MAHSAFSKDQLSNLLRSYHEQAELAITTSHLMNARKKFADFVAYAYQDPVGQVFTRLFHDQEDAACPMVWYRKVTASGPPPPAGDPVLEMAQAYRLIFAFSKEQIDLRYLVSCHYKGDHNEEKFLRLKEQMLLPLLAHLEDLRDFVTEKVPDGARNLDLYDLAGELLRR